MRHFGRNITLAICAILFLQMFFFVYTTAIPLVKSDGWKFIQSFLVPWYNSELTVASLWNHHHPQPLTAILFILNAEFFDLQMHYEAMFASLFSLVIFAVTYKSIHSTLDESAAEFDKNLLIVVAASVLFSLTSIAFLTWSLVTLFNVAIAMSVLFVYYLDKTITLGSSQKFLGLAAGLCLLVIVFPSVARIYLYAAVIVVVLRAVIRRNTAGVIVLAPILLSLVFNYLFFQWVGDSERVSETKIINVLVNKPQFLISYIEYVGVALLSPWLNINLAEQNWEIGESFFINGGLVMLALYLATLCTYFFSGLSQKTILPGVLIIAVLLTALGGAIYRYYPSIQSPMLANVPRYYVHYMIGVVGVLWVWWYSLVRIKKRRLGRAIILMVSAAVLYNQYLSSSWAHSRSPHLRAKMANNAEIMREHANGDMSREISVYMVGGNFPEPYLSGLEVLKERKLNLFRESDQAARPDN